MQLNPLTVQDPLIDRSVIINIQVNADHKTRDQRSVLVAAGISGQVPIMLSGSYGQLNQLIDQAWRRFGRSESEPMDTNNSKGPTYASISVKPTKKPDQKNPKRNSILSLF